MADLTTTLAGEEVVMLPERALYWPRARTLFLADLHWGKAATFRASHVPVPIGTTASDLARLSRALTRTGASHLVILGDLLHARAGWTRSPPGGRRTRRCVSPWCGATMIDTRETRPRRSPSNARARRGRARRLWACTNRPPE